VIKSRGAGLRRFTPKRLRHFWGPEIFGLAAQPNAPSALRFAQGFAYQQNVMRNACTQHTLWIDFETLSIEYDYDKDSGEGGRNFT
jgi:hypothetical protein